MESEHGSNWIVGAVLIVIGALFLLYNLNVINWRLDNWWALFILIPAAGSLGNAWRVYNSNGGRFDGAVTGSLTSGLVILWVALIFLFNLDWGNMWPLLLILGGVGLLLRGLSGN